MSDLDVILSRFSDLENKIASISTVPAAPPEIIDTAELCKRLSVSENTAVKWRQGKKIPFIKVDGTFRYNWPAVVAKLESKTK